MNLKKQHPNMFQLYMSISHYLFLKRFLSWLFHDVLLDVCGVLLIAVAQRLEALWASSASHSCHQLSSAVRRGRWMEVWMEIWMDTVWIFS